MGAPLPGKQGRARGKALISILLFAFFVVAVFLVSSQGDETRQTWQGSDASGPETSKKKSNVDRVTTKSGSFQFSVVPPAQRRSLMQHVIAAWVILVNGRFNPQKSQMGTDSDGGECLWERWKDTAGVTFVPKLHPDSFEIDIQIVQGNSARWESTSHVLFASLTGPQRQYFGCYLQRKTHPTAGMGNTKTFSHFCPHADQLEAGKWTVVVTLVRFHCSLPLQYPSTILDFMPTVGAPDYQALHRLVDYPMVNVSLFEWEKESEGAQIVATRCQGAPAGRWVRTTDVCQQISDSDLGGFCSPAATRDNKFTSTGHAAARQVEHFFLPFSCAHKYFTANEARQCLNRTRLLLVGDSRIRQYRAHIDKWLGEGTAETIDLNAPHIHLGFEQFFRSNQSTRMYDALLSGRTVVFNNLLHDIVELVPYMPTPTVREYLGLDACGTCVGTVASCQCHNKSYPYTKWESWLPRLGELVEQGIERGGGRGRFYWISFHKRQPVDGYQPARGVLYCLHDMVWEAEERAARALRESCGAGHVDMRQHIISAPPGWWDDHLHFGNVPHSLFQHLSTQVLLNQVCPPDNE